MSKKINKILIVDDDKDILFSLSKVLELEGYFSQTAPSGTEAIERAKNDVFDVFLLDIKLPDMEGTELLTQLQSINPEATKIMITGYPSVDNAIRSLNMGASSFFTKPVSIDALLRDIKDKLKERERKKLIAGKKVEEWVKLRISKIQLSEYSKFSEEAADLFNIFGLSRTQAKVYTALNALGVATASEISALSKIRREEVYRVMPDLESRGMIICKLDAPRKFAATEPKTALNILINSKVDSMEREINILKQKKDDLIARLENTSFGIYEENSVEALSRQDNIDMRLSQMTKKAKNSIAMVGSLEEMKRIIHEASEAGDSQIKMRAVVDSSDIQDLDGESGGMASLRRFLQVACKGNCTLDLRQVNKQSFNLVVVDSKEAIWGEPTSKKSEGKVFWTNDPTQVGILRRAFEHLWQEALPYEPSDNDVKTTTLM